MSNLQELGPSTTTYHYFYIQRQETKHGNKFLLRVPTWLSKLLNISHLEYLNSKTS